MSYVFLSYSRRDGTEHVAFLEQAIPTCSDFSVWRDVRGIDPAQDFGAELEKAIEGAERVVVCLTEDTKRDNSFVRREIGYAMVKNKPIYVARFHNTDPHLALINHTYVDFFPPPPEKNLPILCEWLHRPAEFQPSTSTDPFRPYLNGLYQFVVNFLDGAVIRQIDLGITDRPDQVPHPLAPRSQARLHNPLQLRVMPWMQQHTPAPPQIEAFDTFGAAFQAYQERVVLLGEPGAGKTITLLNQLRESITARLADPTQPLPLFAFITSWDAQKRQAFPVWLQQQQPALSQAQIEGLLASGQAVLFLDGLDELGAEREEKVKNEGGKDETRRYDPRQRFIETFATSIGSNRALVTCRVRDYADIGAQIPLNGAVQLNPLSDEQIREYLAELPELLAAIEADDNLKQMLRTPLLMSLFAFAFRDELTPDQRQALRDMAHTDAEDLRDQIIMLYLERRYQWEASKGLPMPYAYEEWLAMLQQVAYRGVATFVDLIHHLLYTNYEGVNKLNILWRDNIALDLPETDVEDFLAFCQRLNIILPIEVNIYCFQHLFLLGTLASFVALVGLEKRQEPAIACQVLGELRLKRTVVPLIHALEDAEARVRSTAAVALGRIGDTRAVVPLIRVLGDVDTNVRSTAAVALGRIGDTRAIEPLSRTLNDEEPWIRSNAAKSLGKIGDGRAVEPLKALLNDRKKPSTYGLRRVRVCDVAAMALERIGTPDALAALEAWLAAGNEIIRE